MTDPKIPADIVHNAARALRSGEHLIADVLQAVLVDLRAAGWIIATRPLPGQIVDERGDFLLVLWPAEINLPYYDGSPGNYTIAPWSVKLTPQPVVPAPAEKSTSPRIARVGDSVILPHAAEDWPAIVTAVLDAEIGHLRVVTFPPFGSNPACIATVPRSMWRFLDEPPPT